MKRTNHTDPEGKRPTNYLAPTQNRETPNKQILEAAH